MHKDDEIRLRHMLDAARLVIDSGEVVRAADIDVDYTRRPEATKTLDDLDSL